MARKRRENVRAKDEVATGRSPESGASYFRFTASTLAGIAGLLAALTLVLYFPISGHPFVNYDDGPYIIDNPQIQHGIDLETIRWAATAFYDANWHPLTWLAHALDFSLYGQNAGGHHLTSMLLHAVNTALVFLLLAVATRSVGKSAVVAAIFGIHPLNVESVAWAAELKNVLCTFFFLLTLGAYGWYARRPGIGRYLLVALFFALGLASKPMVITLPFVLLLLDYWPLGRLKGLGEPSASFPVPQWPAALLVAEKLPLLALSAMSGWVTVQAQTAWKATEAIHAPLVTRLANAVVSYATYLFETFVPLGLALFIPFPVNGIAVWKVAGSLAVLLVVTAAVVWKGRSKPYLLVGWLFFLGTLVPVLGILQVGGQARADRYMYIPMIGLLCAIVWGISDVLDAKRSSFRLRVAAPVVAMAFLFALSVGQISFWESSYDLWTRSIAITRDNALAERNLAMALIRTGRVREFFPHAERAAELDPQDYGNKVNLGNAYSMQGDERRAVQEYEEVMQKATDPRILVSAAVSAGLSYRHLGELEKAEEAYRFALRVAPGNPAASKGLEALGKAGAK